MSRSFSRIIVLLSLFCTLSLVAFAQPGDPPPPDDVVPISGIEILLIAGGAFGGIKLFRRFKKD